MTVLKRIKKIIILAFLAAFIAGNAFCVLAADENNVSETGKEDIIGGGYASTDQISGTRYISILYDATNGLPTSEAYSVLG